MKNEDTHWFSFHGFLLQLATLAYSTSWRRLIFFGAAAILLIYAGLVGVAWRVNGTFSLKVFHSFEQTEIDGEHNKAAVVTAWLHSSDAVPSANSIKGLRTVNHQRYYSEALGFFFAPKLSTSDRKIMFETLKVCLQVIEAAGLDYFLYSGTLIGYNRHNASIIPWDDDVDIAIVTRSKLAVRQAKSKLESEVRRYPGYAFVFVHRYRRYKFFGTLSNNSQEIAPWRKWRWPYIDIQLMRQISDPANGAKEIIQDYSVPSFVYPYDIVYPLRRVLFTEQKIPVFVPSNTSAVLATNFDVTTCVSSSGTDHRRERPTPVIVSVDCSSLKQILHLNFTNFT